MNTEISPAKAVADEAARDRWAYLTALRSRSTHHARQRDPENVLAVWPAEPIPQRYADEMQAIVTRALLGYIEPCCNTAFGGTVSAAWPVTMYCGSCVCDAEFALPGMEFCDCCLAIAGDLRVVFALAGPYVIEGWLCEECSR